jgi:hypothetical protein
VRVTTYDRSARRYTEATPDATDVQVSEFGVIISITRGAIGSREVLNVRIEPLDGPDGYRLLDVREVSVTNAQVRVTAGSRVGE